MAIELTAQLYPFCDRLCEFDAADLTFVMRRDQTIEELIVACVDRTQEVSKRAGKKQMLDIRKLWKIKNSKSKTKNRAYRYGFYWSKRIGACFKSGDQFGVTGPVINARNIAPKRNGNRTPRTAMQKAAARKVAKVLGKQRSTDKQKVAAKVIGKKGATELQKATAKTTGKVVGQQKATAIQRAAAKNTGNVVGQQEATEKQKAAAHAVGKQEATEKQKAAATKVGKRASSDCQKEAVAMSNKVRRIRGAHCSVDVACIGMEKAA